MTTATGISNRANSGVNVEILAICDLQLELGQKTSAMYELRAACRASKDLGSEKLLRACHSLEERLQE